MSAKKKIVFVHPLGANWIPGEKDISRLANIMPPMGLCSLSAWLEKDGHKTSIHDCYAFPHQDDKMLARMRSAPPDFVGFTTTTSSFLDGVRIAEKIKEIMPRVKTVFGGVHLSSLRERLLVEYPVIDYGVVGEGENTLAELVERDGEGPNEIKGLIYRDGEDVIFTGFRERQLDLDTLPFPAYHKLDGFPTSYKLPIFNYPKAPNATALSSRGCPYQCSYCDRSVFRRSYRFHSAEYMFDLAAYLKKKYNIRHINYYDDQFTINRKRIEEFCDLMIGSRIGTTFNCAARAEYLDIDLLKLMKKAGCWMISLGIETGDRDLLSMHRSTNDLDMIREKVLLIKKAGIRAKGLFMMGLPGETEESIDKSMQYVFSLPLDEFNLAKFTPFPGAPLYKNIREFGTFEEDWQLMNCLNFVFVPKAFTKKRLEERYKEFYRNYFVRTRTMLHYVGMLRHSPDSWMRFVGNFKDFFLFTRGYKKTRQQ